VPARIDYAVRALVALAAAQPETVNARRLADAGQIPPGYLYDVLADLRRAELVRVRLGARGGYSLARPAADVTLGAVLRLLDGAPPGPPARAGTGELAERLDRLWSAAAEASLRVLDGLTLADVVAGRLDP
jgi:Rrf2 family protein